MDTKTRKAESKAPSAAAPLQYQPGFGNHFVSEAVAGALPVGPILIGPAKPAHILTPSVTARGIVNMTAIAAAEAVGG